MRRIISYSSNPRERRGGQIEGGEGLEWGEIEGRGGVGGGVEGGGGRWEGGGGGEGRGGGMVVAPGHFACPAYKTLWSQNNTVFKCVPLTMNLKGHRLSANLRKEEKTNYQS